MTNNKDLPFIFYLTLSEHLPDTFYVFDRCLKEFGFILVPVAVDQLQKVVSFSEQSDAIVICSVKDSREQKIYNQRVRGPLKYLLKNKRISFMHLSSFSRLNDAKFYTMTKNYFFMKYPLDAERLSVLLAGYFASKAESSRMWPGGKRASLGAVA